MKTNNQTVRFWSTASFGGDTETSPGELLLLGDHLGACKHPHTRLFALQCMAEATRGFLAARFVTTMLGVAVLIGVAALTL